MASDVVSRSHCYNSSLSGCYLLIVVGEPNSVEHRDVILQKINKGFLSWDIESTGCCISAEMQYLVDQAPVPEEAKNGEKLIQFVSENLVTEVLINPQLNTLSQCMRNLLSSYTKHKHIIYAGYAFAGSGSWILQDGTYSFADFLDSFHDVDVQRIFKAYENCVTIHVHCSPEGQWNTAQVSHEPWSKMADVSINPDDRCCNLHGVVNFVNFLGNYVTSKRLEELLEPSDVVGNIRFSRPTLYIFPGGQGDSALFGVNGFNMLIDGGFNRKACFWDFARHLDRVDALLVTRINNSNINGVSSFLRRKCLGQVYPKVGHVFCNVLDRKHSPDGDKDTDGLLVSLSEEGQQMMDNLRHIGLKPQNCYRDSTTGIIEPLNLYHKVGHGKLDMYVLNPARDSREVKEFLQQWNSQSSGLGSSRLSIRVGGDKELLFPVPNLMSICAILVWQPADPDDSITRILFPGSAPQSKIFEGLHQVQQLQIFKNPVCSEKSLGMLTRRKNNQLDDLISDHVDATAKIVPPEKKSVKYASVAPAVVRTELPPPTKKTEDVRKLPEALTTKNQQQSKLDNAKLSDRTRKLEKTLTARKVDVPKLEAKAEVLRDSGSIKATTKLNEGAPRNGLHKPASKVPGIPKAAAPKLKMLKEASNKKVVEEKNIAVKNEAGIKEVTTKKKAPSAVPVKGSSKMLKSETRRVATKSKKVVEGKVVDADVVEGERVSFDEKQSLEEEVQAEKSKFKQQMEKPIPDGATSKDSEGIAQPPEEELGGGFVSLEAQVPDTGGETVTTDKICDVQPKVATSVAEESGIVELVQSVGLQDVEEELAMVVDTEKELAMVVDTEEEPAKVDEVSDVVGTVEVIVAGKEESSKEIDTKDVSESATIPVEVVSSVPSLGSEPEEASKVVDKMQEISDEGELPDSLEVVHGTLSSEEDGKSSPLSKSLEELRLNTSLVERESGQASGESLSKEDTKDHGSHKQADVEGIVVTEPVQETVCSRTEEKLPEVAAFTSVALEQTLDDKVVSSTVEKKLGGTLLEESAIKPVLEEFTIKPVQEEFVIKPVQEEFVIKPVQEEAVIKPVQEESAIKPVPEESAIKPVQEESAIKPVQEESAIKPVQEESAIKPVQEESAIKPVQEESAIKPVQEEFAIKPVPEESAIKPVQEEFAIKPVQEESFTEFVADEKPKIVEDSRSAFDCSVSDLVVKEDVVKAQEEPVIENKGKVIPDHKEVPEAPVRELPEDKTSATVHNDRKDVKTILEDSVSGLMVEVKVVKDVLEGSGKDKLEDKKIVEKKEEKLEDKNVADKTRKKSFDLEESSVDVAKDHVVEVYQEMKMATAGETVKEMAMDKKSDALQDLKAVVKPIVEDTVTMDKTLPVHDEKHIGILLEDSPISKTVEDRLLAESDLPKLKSDEAKPDVLRGMSVTDVPQSVTVTEKTSVTTNFQKQQDASTVDLKAMVSLVEEVVLPTGKAEGETFSKTTDVQHGEKELPKAASTVAETVDDRKTGVGLEKDKKAQIVPQEKGVEHVTRVEGLMTETTPPPKTEAEKLSKPIQKTLEEQPQKLSVDKDFISGAVILSPIPEDAPKPAKDPAAATTAVPPQSQAQQDCLRTPDEVADLPIHEEVPSEYEGYYHIRAPLHEIPETLAEADDFPEVIGAPLLPHQHQQEQPDLYGTSQMVYESDFRIDDDVHLSTVKADHPEVITISDGTSPSSTPLSPKSPKDLAVDAGKVGDKFQEIGEKKETPWTADAPATTTTSVAGASAIVESKVALEKEVDTKKIDDGQVVTTTAASPTVERKPDVSQVVTTSAGATVVEGKPDAQVVTTSVVVGGVASTVDTVVASPKILPVEEIVPKVESVAQMWMEVKGPHAVGGGETERMVGDVPCKGKEVEEKDDRKLLKQGDVGFLTKEEEKVAGIGASVSKAADESSAKDVGGKTEEEPKSIEEIAKSQSLGGVETSKTFQGKDFSGTLPEPQNQFQEGGSAVAIADSGDTVGPKSVPEDCGKSEEHVAPKGIKLEEAGGHFTGRSYGGHSDMPLSKEVQKEIVQATGTSKSDVIQREQDDHFREDYFLDSGGTSKDVDPMTQSFYDVSVTSMGGDYADYDSIPVPYPDEKAMDDFASTTQMGTRHTELSECAPAMSIAPDVVSGAGDRIDTMTTSMYDFRTDVTPILSQESKWNQETAEVVTTTHDHTTSGKFDDFPRKIVEVDTSGKEYDGYYEVRDTKLFGLTTSVEEHGQQLGLQDKMGESSKDTKELPLSSVEHLASRDKLGELRDTEQRESAGTFKDVMTVTPVSLKAMVPLPVVDANVETPVGATKATALSTQLVADTKTTTSTSGYQTTMNVEREVLGASGSPLLKDEGFCSSPYELEEVQGKEYYYESSAVANAPIKDERDSSRHVLEHPGAAGAAMDMPQSLDHPHLYESGEEGEDEDEEQPHGPHSQPADGGAGSWPYQYRSGAAHGHQEMLPDVAQSPIYSGSYVSADDDTENEYMEHEYNYRDSDADTESPLHRPSVPSGIRGRMSFSPSTGTGGTVESSSDEEDSSSQARYTTNITSSHHLDRDRFDEAKDDDDSMTRHDRGGDGGTRPPYVSGTGSSGGHQMLEEGLHQEDSDEDLSEAEHVLQMTRPEAYGSARCLKEELRYPVDSYAPKKEDQVLELSGYSERWAELDEYSYFHQTVDDSSPYQQSAHYDSTPDVDRKDLVSFPAPLPPPRGSGTSSMVESPSSSSEDKSGHHQAEEDEPFRSATSKGPFHDWGEPMGLPSPPPLPDGHHAKMVVGSGARVMTRPSTGSQQNKYHLMTGLNKNKVLNGKAEDVMDMNNKDAENNNNNNHHLNNKKESSSVKSKEKSGGGGGGGKTRQQSSATSSPKRCPPSLGIRSSPIKSRNVDNMQMSDSKRSQSGGGINKMSLPGSPIYVDLTYVPHHGNPFYSDVQFFSTVRARYYVFSGTNPSVEVFNALLEAKKTWEDPDMEVTVVPTYDTDTLGYWFALNEDQLSKHKIDLAPSAVRCTINLQDHETSCSAYRLEF